MEKQDAKPRRRIMRQFKINEISAVDTPAQEGARALIMKRHEAEDDVPADQSAAHSEKPVKEAEMTKQAADKAKQKDGDDQTAFNEKIAEIEAKLARQTSVAELNDAEKAHFLTLDADAQDGFLAKSADKRKVVLDDLAEAAKDLDPVVYTTSDGIELRKSDNAALVAMAKKNDELAAKNAKLETAAIDAELAKRVDNEFANLPGTQAVKVAMLKALEEIEGDDERQEALVVMKAGDNAMAAAFLEKGHGHDPKPGSPQDELDSLTRKYQGDHADLSFAQAQAQVLKTAAGKRLYEKTLN